MRPLVVASFAAIVLVARARPVLADSSPDAAAAEQLFVEGRKLMDAGSFAAACPKLETSQRLDPGAGTLLNLAGCYEGMGRTASAWATFRDAEGAAERAGRADWKRSAHEHAEALTPKLSRLRIDVAPGARIEGLVVERDGRAIDSAILGEAVPVDPGGHVVTAHAPGRASWSLRVDVAPRPETARVEVPVLVAVPAAASHDVAPSSDSPARTVGFVLGGVGIVAASAGAVLGLVANSTYKDAIANDCGGHATTCSPAGVEHVDSAKTQALASTIAFIAGGAALAGGVVLVLTAPGPARETVQVSVRPTARGAALGLGGTF